MPQPRPLPLALFAAAAASPLLLLALAALQGGAWAWVALGWMTLAAVALDMAIPLVTGPGEEAEFPLADALLVVLGILGLAALPLVLWAVAGQSALSAGQRLALFLAAGLWFGQVGHPAAHELIHRPRPLFWLGTALYAGLGFGHHASAHRLVHHRFVATPQDPNSAAEGESFYRFARRAWPGSFRAGWRAEADMRARAPGRAGLHPYAAQLAMTALALGLAVWIAGLAGALVWAGLALHFGLQVLMSDYIQHYGLTRPLGPDGKPAPVGAQHSWNTPHWFTAAMMLNAPRHSDHHAHPTRPYPALRLPEDAPLLPWPLPLAGAVALFPRHWRRRMRPLLTALPQSRNGGQP